jgi:hypothetical protein
VTHTSWQAENAEWLHQALRRLRLELERRALWVERGGSGRAEWLLAEADARAEQEFFASDPEARSIDGTVSDLRADLSQRAAAMAGRGRPPALVLLAELAGLTQLERDILLLAAAPAFDSGFASAYAQLHGDARLDFATAHLAMSMFVESGPDRMMAAGCLMPHRRLRSLRLIRVDPDDSPSMLRRLLVDERVTDYLVGSNRLDSRLDSILSDIAATATTPSAETAGRAAAELITAEPGHWQTLNLVGTLADGGEQVARLACDSVGLRLARLDGPRLATRTPEERAALMSLLGREALLAGLAIVIDASTAELDSPLAAVIDELIELLPATLFVVSSERWPSQDGVHIVFVSRSTRAEQEALWRASLSAVPNSVNGEVAAIVQQFDFGPAAISEVVGRAARRSRDGISAADLWRACREQTGAAMKQLAHRIAPCYRWNDIVVSADVRLQLRELADQVSQRSRVYEAWGFGAQLSRGRGITALFSGPSGTGKTMAAEILAGHLDLDLYKIDLAGVVSKYIGETEKNLRRVFDAAERSGSILFFDEADALFGTRTEVHDSHDRYANVEINYLLQRMEDYGGLAILATNRRASMDNAFLRRLRFVIEFPFPSADDRRRIWEKVFPQQAALNDVDFSFLSRLEMTGGSIRAVAVNAAFLAAAEGSPVRMSHLVRAVAREYAKLAKPINPADFGAYYAVLRP